MRRIGLAGYLVGFALAAAGASCGRGLVEFDDGVYVPMEYAYPEDHMTDEVAYQDARIVVSTDEDTVVITYEEGGYGYRVTYDIVDRYESYGGASD